MGDRIVDEASLVWAGAVVTGVDPADLAASVDIATLTRVAAAAGAATEPVDAAAAVLVGVVRGQPFPASNAAIAWLAATEILAAAQCRVVARPDQAVELCAGIRSRSHDAGSVASALRSLVAELGFACPVCNRRVYVLDDAARREIMPGSTPFELTARCAYEHGAHDRSGRSTARAAVPLVDDRQPVLARGACGSVLVATQHRTLVLSPYCDEPAIVRVGEVDDVRPGDLVGRWDVLVDRSQPLGFVPAGEVHIDGGEGVDVSRLRRALRRARTVEDRPGARSDLCAVGAP